MDYNIRSASQCELTCCKLTAERGTRTSSFRSSPLSTSSAVSKWKPLARHSTGRMSSNSWAGMGNAAAALCPPLNSGSDGAALLARLLPRPDCSPSTTPFNSLAPRASLLDGHLLQEADDCDIAAQNQPISSNGFASLPESNASVSRGSQSDVTRAADGMSSTSKRCLNVPIEAGGAQHASHHSSQARPTSLNRSAPLIDTRPARVVTATEQPIKHGVVAHSSTSLASDDVITTCYGDDMNAITRKTQGEAGHCGDASRSQGVALMTSDGHTGAAANARVRDCVTIRDDVKCEKSSSTSAATTVRKQARVNPFDMTTTTYDVIDSCFGDAETRCRSENKQQRAASERNEIEAREYNSAREASASGGACDQSAVVTQTSVPCRRSKAGGAMSDELGRRSRASRTKRKQRERTRSSRDVDSKKSWCDVVVDDSLSHSIVSCGGDMRVIFEKMPARTQRSESVAESEATQTTDPSDPSLLLMKRKHDSQCARCCAAPKQSTSSHNLATFSANQLSFDDLDLLSPSADCLPLGILGTPSSGEDMLPDDVSRAFSSTTPTGQSTSVTSGPSTRSPSPEQQLTLSSVALRFANAFSSSDSPNDATSLSQKQSFWSKLRRESRNIESVDENGFLTQSPQSEKKESEALQVVPNGACVAQAEDTSSRKKRVALHSGRGGGRGGRLSSKSGREKWNAASRLARRKSTVRLHFHSRPLPFNENLSSWFRVFHVDMSSALLASCFLLEGGVHFFRIVCVVTQFTCLHVYVEDYLSSVCDIMSVWFL